MARIEVWNGEDAYDIPAEVWRANYHPAGLLLFVEDDQGRLLTVVASAVDGSDEAITKANEAQVRRRIVAEFGPDPSEPPPPPPPTPTPDYVTRDEFDMLMTMVLEG